MKEGFYILILILPILVTSLFPAVILLIAMRYKGKRPNRLVATHVFPRIIKEKTDGNGATSWLFKDVDLTEEKELLSDVFVSLSLLFLALFSSVLVVFYQLLLLDVSYNCNHNETTRDCFEYKLWDAEIFWKDPIDCNNAAAV